MFHDPTWEIIFASILLCNSTPAGCVRTSETKKDYGREAAAQRAQYMSSLRASGDGGSLNSLGGAWNGLGRRCTCGGQQ